MDGGLKLCRPPCLPIFSVFLSACVPLCAINPSFCLIWNLNHAVLSFALCLPNISVFFAGCSHWHVCDLTCGFPTPALLPDKVACPSCPALWEPDVTFFSLLPLSQGEVTNGAPLCTSP